MKRFLLVLFTAVFCGISLLTCLPGAAATTEEAWNKTNTLIAGETYMLSHTGIRAYSDSTSHDYLLMGYESPSAKGMAFADRPTDGSEVKDALWTINEVDGGWTFYSVSQRKYLNMELINEYDNGVQRGRTFLSSNPQVLSITQTGGKVKIHTTMGGNIYYVRFTNLYGSASGQKSYSCWHAGVGTSSNTFDLYRFYAPGPEAEYNNTTEPLFKVACFADPHIDYGIQSWSTPIRVSSVTSAEFVRDTLGAADVVLVGGDLTSRNDRNATWNNALIARSQQAIYDTFSLASKDGKVMMITGNHDNEAGLASGDTVHSGNYDSYLTENVGAFTAALRFNDMGIGTSKYNELLCYRYTVGKMEFININTPYRTYQGPGYIYGAQIDWVENQLKAIGKDKTVIVQCHYPVGDVVSPSGDPTGNSRTKLKAVLEAYPNVIYTYGHVHGDDYKFAWYSTSELVVPQGGMTKLADNSYRTDSYIIAHMGSMGYYNNMFNNYKGLAAKEPGINQLLMIEFYIDHITFRYYNTGEKTAVSGVREISSFTVVRDLSSQLELPPTPPTDSSSNPSAGTGSSVGSGSVSSDSSEPSDSGTPTNTSGNGGGNSSDSLDSSGEIFEGDDSSVGSSEGESDSSGVNSSDPLDTDFEDDDYVPDDSEVSVEEESTFVPPVIDTEVNATKPSENAMNANIAGTADELKQAILTDYEQQWAADGDQVQITLTVKDIAEQIAEEVKNLIRKEIGDGAVGAWLGLELYSQMEGEEAVQVTKTNGKVTVTVTVPESLRNKSVEFKRNYSVLQTTDETVTVLPSQYDAASGTLTFETDNFTSVALAYNDVAVPSTDTQTEGSSDAVTDLSTDENSATDSLPGGTTVPGGEDRGGLPVGAIVGIVAGTVAVLSGGGFCLWYFVFKKRSVSAERGEE